MENQPDVIETQEESPQEEFPPATFHFDLVFRGKEYPVDLTHKQIQDRLQILRSYQENESEFWQNSKMLQPYSTIIQTDEFQAFLKEMERKEIDPHPSEEYLPPKERLKTLYRTFKESPTVSTAARLILARQETEVQR